MTKEKKEPKSSKGIVLPFIIGMGLLLGSWFYWPTAEVLFMANYFKRFNSAINPMFLLGLYVVAVLLLVFALARLVKRFSIFMGTFLPLAVYLGYSEWNSYHAAHKYIDAMGLLSLLYNVFVKRAW